MKKSTEARADPGPSRWVSQPDTTGDQHSRVAVAAASTLELMGVQHRRRLLIGGGSCGRQGCSLEVTDDLRAAASPRQPSLPSRQRATTTNNERQSCWSRRGRSPGQYPGLGSGILMSRDCFRRAPNVGNGDSLRRRGSDTQVVMSGFVCLEGEVDANTPEVAGGTSRIRSSASQPNGSPAVSGASAGPLGGCVGLRGGLAGEFSR
jgi:hypothetical protein